MFKKFFTKPRPKVRFFTNFLTHARFVVQVCFPQMTNCILYGPYLPTGGRRWLPWLHFEKWAFLYHHHNFELSTVNCDYLGPLKGTWWEGLIPSNTEEVNILAPHEPQHFNRLLPLCHQVEHMMNLEESPLLHGLKQCGNSTTVYTYTCACSTCRN